MYSTQGASAYSYNVHAAGRKLTQYGQYYNGQWNNGQWNNGQWYNGQQSETSALCGNGASKSLHIKYSATSKTHTALRHIVPERVLGASMAKQHFVEKGSPS